MGKPLSEKQTVKKQRTKPWATWLQAAWIELNAIYERCQIVQINGQCSQVRVCLFGKMSARHSAGFWACNGKCGSAVFRGKETPIHAKSVPHTLPTVSTTKMRAVPTGCATCSQPISAWKISPVCKRTQSSVPASR